jgi:hypothetical protein
MKLFKYFCLLSFMASCGSEQTPQELLSVDLRSGMDHPSMLALQDEIESVEYIPLETTADPASLLDGVSEYAVTSNYIYVSPVKEQRIVQFDRKGQFVKTLIPFGQGPGEFSDFLMGMQADEKNNRLYLFSSNKIMVYTLDGEFIQSLNHDYTIVYQRMVGQDRFASVAFPYVPFESGSYGLGVFSDKADTIAMKNDFSSPLVSHEKAGFTIALATAYSDMEESVLFKTGSNDTVFRVTADDILPACVLRTGNSDKEVIRSLDATDFSSLKRKFGEDYDIFVSDMFETPSNYYFRCRYNAGHYVASVHKKTGQVLAEKCAQPGDIRALGDANLLYGMLGTKSYQDFPVWGRTQGDCLVQLLTAYELHLYKEKCNITVPPELKEVNDDSNPVFIVYKLRRV